MKEHSDLFAAIDLGSNSFHMLLVQQIAGSVIKNQIEGVIATNTTLDREAVAGLEHAEEAGGLSGLPVQQKSIYVIENMRKIIGDRMPIIGVGGIDDVASAKAKFEAGAQLIQIYTGFIYQGPSLIKKIVTGL